MFFFLISATQGSCKERDASRHHWDPEEHVEEEQGGPGQHLEGLPGPGRADQHGQADGGAVQEHLHQDSGQTGWDN